VTLRDIYLRKFFGLLLLVSGRIYRHIITYCTIAIAIAIACIV